MAVNLSIKGVPDALAETLRLRAMAHHRSLQGELMAIIEAAAANGAVPAPRAFQARHATTAYARGTKSIDQIAAEARAQHPQPQRRYGRSVDLIREMRDHG